jgi:hypothetical protein
LSGEPLVSKRINNKWVIDLESKSDSLGCKTEIGHNESRLTEFASGHIPVGINYALIDAPGYKEDRDRRISDFYSLYRVTKNMRSLNFLLVILYEELKNGGNAFNGE